MAELSAKLSSEQKEKQAKWAAASGFFGAVAEYYDFALYGPAAALFLGPLFFTPLGEYGAQLASLASFAVAYLARPAGAILFGQWGDRAGRRKVMLVSLSIMGGATFLIGCLPTYVTGGWYAALLLVCCRITQGLSAGIEQSGSGTISAEAAPAKKRAFYTSSTMIGVSIGWFLGPAILSFLSINQQWLMSGGWRIPFLLAGPMVIFALWVRSHVVESDSCAIKKYANGSTSPRTTPPSAGRCSSPRADIFPPHETHTSAGSYSSLSPPSAGGESFNSRFPLLEILKSHPLNLLRVIGCSLHMLVGVTFNVFVVGFAVNALGVSKPLVLGALSFAGISTAFLQPLWAILSDRVGRRWIFMGSCIAMILTLPLVFLSLQTKNWVLITVAMTGFYAIVMAGNVVQASFYPELFPRKVRLTGVAVGTQIGLVFVGLSPLIYDLLSSEGPYGFIPGCVFAGGCWAIAAFCAWTAPETAPSQNNKSDF